MSGLTRLGTLLAQLRGEPPGRIAPREELVNVLEFAEMAQRTLSGSTYSAIAGGDRGPFDRITFRPRLMVNMLALDLTTELFGDKLFAPILVGPMSEQGRFHAEGELATARGASAAKAAMVVSAKSSQSLDKIAAQIKTSWWYQVFPGPKVDDLRGPVRQAVDAGCKAVCITVGAPNPGTGSASLSWDALDRVRQGIHVPVLLKGIMSPEEARTAVGRGVQGIIVSNYGGLGVPGVASTMEMLPSIVEAVGGKAPVLIDGSFRKGSDVLKALALGARAVLVGRPVMWGLAAYGADGVQTVLELLQTELARSVAMCGRPNMRSIDKTVVRVHEA